MSQADMHRNKINNKQFCKNVLLQTSEFVSAVQGRNPEAAANAAAEVMLSILAQHQTSHKNSGGSQRGLGNLWGMQEALFSKGDSVRLKHHLVPRNPDAGEGTVVEVHRVEDGPPTLVVRWSSGEVLEQAVSDLMKCNVAGGMTRDKMTSLDCMPLKSQKSANKHKQPVLKLAKDIMDLEENIPWRKVKESFRSRRTEWRNQCKIADSVPAIASLLTELLAVVTISDDMPNTPFKCTQDGFLQSLNTLAASPAPGTDVDAVNQVTDMWERVIKPEFNRWIEVHDMSHVGRQVHVASSMQALERCSGHGLHTYKQAPIAWMLANYQERDLLRKALKDELDFCRGKLAQIEHNPAQLLTDTLLRGVTYDQNGLGGSYGGAPRSKGDMLHGLMCYDSEDSELDNGSEATDLRDSCDLQGTLFAGDSQPVSSRQAGLTAAGHTRDSDAMLVDT